MNKNVRFGQWLIEKEKITARQLEKALEAQKGTTNRLGFIRNNFV